MSLPSFFRVNQSGEEEFDAVQNKQVTNHTPPPLQLNLSAVNGDEDKRGENDETETTDEDAYGTTSTSFASRLVASFMADKKIIAATILALIGAAAVGISISGQNTGEIQKSFAATVNGKAGKSVPFCEATVPAITCGQTFTNMKLDLSDDLLCTDEVGPQTPNSVLKSLNAAVTLEGPNAVLDCKDHTIRQLSAINAAFCTTTAGSRTDTSSKQRKDMKVDCGLFYQAGILLKDGATAINCRVEQFYDGFLIVGGGEVKKSEAVGNNKGVYIEDESGSISKVSDVYTHINRRGVSVYIPSTAPKALASVEVEKVLIENNLEGGMRLRGQEIIVKDSTVRYNGDTGISIGGNPSDSSTIVDFQGEVSSYQNKDNGVNVNEGKKGTGPNDSAQVNVVGVLNTYLNGGKGLDVVSSITARVNVEDGGSFNSCQNTDVDIRNAGSGSFIGGGGYICGGTGGKGNLPTCAACPTCIS